ncbi:MAG TPA: hypothetical protein DCR64_15190 [Vibrio sp.]|nr:hypothetical protein [Vibrio sp.]
MPILEETELHDLLVKGQISVISVDTNIFDQKRLNLNSGALQSLTGLRDQPIDFVLSGTVAREVLAHLEKSIREALVAVKKGIGQALFAFDTKNPSREEVLEQLTRAQTEEAAAKQRWDQFVDNTGCTLLADTDLVGTKDIYDAYFAGKPPFGSGRKKDEFPDALALYALEQIGSERNTGILVVSKDDDWRAFCAESERLFLITNVERALALVTNAPLELRKALFAWISDKGDGFEELNHAISNNVERISFTAIAHPTFGEVETAPWDGELFDILWPEEEDIDIIELKADDHNRVVRIVASLPLELQITVPVELEFSVWDSIDKDSVGMGVRTIDAKEEVPARATVTLSVHNQGSEDEEFEFQASELDISFHEIDLGSVDVFDPEECYEE